MAEFPYSCIIVPPGKSRGHHVRGHYSSGRWGLFALCADGAWSRVGCRVELMTEAAKSSARRLCSVLPRATSQCATSPGYHVFHSVLCPVNGDTKLAATSRLLDIARTRPRDQNDTGPVRIATRQYRIQPTAGKPGQAYRYGTVLCSRRLAPEAHSRYVALQRCIVCQLSPYALPLVYRQWYRLQLALPGNGQHVPATTVGVCGCRA